MQNIVKITDSAKSTDISPDGIAKIFKDIGDSPEKLRAVLNLWFVPQFKPNFVPDQDYAAAGLKDVEFLSTLDVPRPQSPYRMFDIATSNLIEFPATGVLGHYCILSHRWKGDELTLAYIRRAREKDKERRKEAFRDSKAAGITMNSRGTRKNDVQIVLNQCRLDILEQEEIIRELAGEAVKQRLDNAKKDEAQKKSKLRFAEIELEIFGKLIVQMNEKGDERMKGKAQDIPTTEDRTGTMPSTTMVNDHDVAKDVVKDAKCELEDAKRELEEARREEECILTDANFFNESSGLREAVDELVSCLQRWKSAIKLDQSITQAKNIFKNRLFQEYEKEYLWLDTCCIDKQNANELSESLSLMGDWYADTEFCLVQLDTKFVEADAIQDWDLFQKKERKEEYLLDPNTPIIEGFEHISKQNPEWSERAWTLQELVMSKVTYYANSEWTQISRPVESLGYYYYLIPFIELYNRGDTKNIYATSLEISLESWVSKSLPGILEGYKFPEKYKELENHIERIHTSNPIQTEGSDTRAKAEEEADRIKNALQLIAVLDGLGVQIPNDLAMETAISSMTRAIYLTASDLTDKQEPSVKDSSRELLQLLKIHLPAPTLTAPTITEEEQAQHAINFLLQCLVAETQELILFDRQYIAKFGKVDLLKTWQRGTIRSRFFTEDVMSISYKRKSTVPTDQLYALMGILGVRFPTFHAEGYCRVLSRLLDVILIAHNDVSVFNWSGMEMGSRIRGRTMYPSSHKAFSSEEDRGQRYNLLLSTAVRSKMKEVMVTYHGVIYMLREVINFVKEKDWKNVPLSWIQKLIGFIDGASFQDLDPELSNVGKIIRYILEKCGNPPSPNPQPIEIMVPREVISNPSSENNFSPFGIRSSLSGFKNSAGKNDWESSPRKGLKLSGFGKGSIPSFGGRSSWSAEKDVAKEPVSQAPAPVPVPAPVTDTPDEQSKPSPNSSWEAFDSDVLKYIDGMARQREEKEKAPSHPLPPALQEFQFHIPKPEIAKQAVRNLGDDDMISPNPIIVNNSGIESIFDTRRVIVTIIDPNTLRSKIARAISPHEKISGWCSISTGFARVVTSFSCEKHILEKELDVVEAVENKVLKEQEKKKGEKRGDRILKSLSITRVVTKGKDKEKKTEQSGNKKDAIPPNDPESANPETGEDAKKLETNGTEDKKADDAENTEEELLISRMIDFIQQPQLRLVVDEWVLARFFSVPGAKWFLCHLELGLTHQFYGRRIATGEIDFHNSTPEPGLVSVWQTYMERKKENMCTILGKYLKSKESAGKSQERLKEGSEFAKRGIEIAMKELDRRPKSPKSPITNKEESVPEGDDNEDSDEESFMDRMLDQNKLMNKAFDQGKLAAKAFSEHTVMAIVEKFFEKQADFLDRNLSVSVLKRTPKSLQTAVENMNDNRNLLPAMFHPSVRVHMF
ncbi:hypothetical protein B7463_g9923, partial [Scytalidium lignicola]